VNGTTAPAKMPVEQFASRRACCRLLASLGFYCNDRTPRLFKIRRIAPPPPPPWSDPRLTGYYFVRGYNSWMDFRQGRNRLAAFSSTGSACRARKVDHGVSSSSGNLPGRRVNGCQFIRQEVPLRRD